MVNGRITRRVAAAAVESEHRQRLWEKQTAAYEDAVQEVLARQIRRGAALQGQIGRAVLAEPAQPRRLRVSTRKVKAALSRYNKADPYRPTRSTKITAIHARITPAPHQTPLTTAPDP